MKTLLEQDPGTDLRPLTIAVDACGVVGGGFTNLRGVFEHGNPERHGIERIRIWAPRRMLDQLPDRPWLERLSVRQIEGPRWRRVLWERFALPRAVDGCDLCWSPGLFAPARIEPLVAMAQNSLLFDLEEMRRYGYTLQRLRLEVLRRSQIRSIRKAAGVIFLSDWGEQLVRGVVDVEGATCVVPHGIDARFRFEPRRQRPLSDYSKEDPFRLVYVSMIDVYKHQWHVARAVDLLRKKGLPIEITFAGPSYAPAMRRFQSVLDELDPDGAFLHYVGPLPYDQMPSLYRDADVCVFASTCENLPNILLEAMGAGIPIACSDRSPMKELIGGAGELFDPESPEDIASSVEKLARDPDLRDACARKASQLAEPYTWERCAEGTFAFLARVATEQRRRNPG
jgi:glycosyltransferase involved in cell wall biosynthesis